MKPKMDLKSIALGAALVVSAGYAADQAPALIAHVFTAGTPIKAAEVNANFAALSQAVQEAKTGVLTSARIADGSVTASKLKTNNAGKDGYALTYKADGSLDWVAAGTGPTGPQGPAGPVGPAGPQGAKGDTGAQGLKGDTGAAGAVGPAGATGPAGAQGVKGDTGAAGADGAAGPVGPAGATGPAGAQGVKGDKGDTGAQGEQGIQGVKGDKGDTGAQGEQGIQGVKGDKGDTGATGATGPQGPAGADGSNLITGYEIITQTGTASTTAPVKATCTGTKKVIGGGVKTNKGDVTSYPAGTTGWEAVATSSNANGANLSVYAICANTM